MTENPLAPDAQHPDLGLEALNLEAFGKLLETLLAHYRGPATLFEEWPEIEELASQARNQPAAAAGLSIEEQEAALQELAGEIAEWPQARQLTESLLAHYQGPPLVLLEDWNAVQQAGLYDPALTSPLAYRFASGLLRGRRLAEAWPDLDETTRRRRLAEVHVFHAPGVVEALCRASVEAACCANGQAQAFAEAAGELARRAVEAEPGDALLTTAQARATATLANVLRVAGELTAAELTFARMAPTLDPVHPTGELAWTREAWYCDPGQARVVSLSLLASLMRDQRRGPEALALLELAERELREVGDHLRQLADPSQPARIALKKAKLLVELGNYQKSQTVIAELAARTRPFPTLETLRQLYAAWCEVYLGNPGRARATLQLIPEGGFPLQTTWCRAYIATAEGHSQEAVELLERVLAGFRQRGATYDAALACLELAVVLAEAGRWGEVRSLAAEALPFFFREQIDPECRSALALLQTAEEVQRLREARLFVQLARVNRNAVFQG